ncbi:MAG: preprotein translocase subunit SecY [Oscillospiraceae bacterium]|nr:preprotein translocase subunit SecY [Oscillospiraceae bacterium]
MFQTFRNAWKIEDLRKRILFTLFILFIFRLGAAIVVPFIDGRVIKEALGANPDSIFAFFDMMTGGGFTSSTIFALSIQPYINASIIINLLQVAIPALERLSREGEDGRQKINVITRYTTVGIAITLAIVYYFLVKRNNALVYTTGFDGIFAAVVIVLCFTGGAVLVMWLGEQIDANGIGSGISLLIFTGIVSNLVNIAPQVITYFRVASGTYEGAPAQPIFFILVPLIIAMFFAMLIFIVVMTSAERRIPVQYAKKVVGRKLYGGQSTHIPIKVNMTGVLPVIFASSILSVPATIKDFFSIGSGFWSSFLGFFSTNNWGYAAFYAVLIVAFNYFYVTVQYQPMQMANDMRKNSGTIPGIRPGKPTADFIQRVISKITFIGAIFLVIVAILPIIIDKTTGIKIALGGTSVLIMVGVALEVSNTLESYMLMRHHKGFLE